MDSAARACSITTIVTAIEFCTTVADVSRSAAYEGA
jgi:hypothetical protein